MAGNRAIAYMGPRKLEIQNLEYPSWSAQVAESASTASSSSSS
jgi:hypothetical protein